MWTNITSFFIELDVSIRQSINRIDSGSRGIVLVVDSERRLLGTITDGDIRRAMLSGINMDAPVSTLLAHKVARSNLQPLTALEGSERVALLQLMKEHSVRQIPLLDRAGMVVDLVTLDDLVPTNTLPLQAVIMAGGQGTRLRPLTEDLPKPMLPLGGRPLMERTIEQLREAGIHRVNVATHYKSEKIVEHFGDGRKFGVELNYVGEESPLGTAGALALLETPQEPLLVINGDILTHVDVRSMLTFHQEQKAVLTVAVRKYDLNVPYGVVECEGAFVKSLAEKPLLTFFVNAGIYLLEPTAHRFIPMGQRFDMTDLIERLLEAGEPVASFPVLEYWLDIGRPEDYEQAQRDSRDGRLGD